MGGWRWERGTLVESRHGGAMLWTGDFLIGRFVATMPHQLPGVSIATLLFPKSKPKVCKISSVLFTINHTQPDLSTTENKEVSIFYTVQSKRSHYFLVTVRVPPQHWLPSSTCLHFWSEHIKRLSLSASAILWSKGRQVRLVTFGEMVFHLSESSKGWISYWEIDLIQIFFKQRVEGTSWS